MRELFQALSVATSRLLDGLFPPRCEVCSLTLRGRRQGAEQWLCQLCLEALPAIGPPYCNICGEPYDGEIIGEFRCGNCADMNVHFDFAVAAFHAEGPVRQLVHRYKYQRELYLRGLLGQLIRQVFHDARLQNLTSSDWVLAPVPLHLSRRWWREFNQSWELCRELSRSTGLPAWNPLRRVRLTKSQARLSRRERLQNLKNSFQLRRLGQWKDRLKGKNILLVDDVLTTGSTASECAKVLRRDGGAEKVVVISVGRG